MGMFWRSFSLFVLLLGLSNGYFEFGIRFDRCKEEAACFLRGSCIETVGDQGPTRGSENELVRFKEESATISANQYCYVVMNIKPYSRNVFLVTVTVRTSDWPIKWGSVVLQHGSIQFPCGKVLNGLVVDNNFQLYTRGEVYNTEYLVYCAFEIHNYGSTDKSLAEKFEAYAAKPTIKFADYRDYQADYQDYHVNEAKAKDYLIQYHENADILYREVAKLSEHFCSPLNIETIPPGGNKEYTSEYQLGELDNTRSPLSCNTLYWQNGLDLALRIVRENGVVVFPTKMECITTPLGWQYDDATSKGNLIPEGERLKGHCARNMCSLCDDLSFTTLCTGCEQPSMTERDGCKVADCANNKWGRDGGVHVGTVECRQDTENPTEGTWFYSGSNDKVLRDHINGCSDKYCSLCNDISVDVNSCVGCTNPASSIKDGCKVAECPDNRWVKGNEHVGTVECRQDTENPTEGTWFYSGSNDKVHDDGCFNFCAEFSNIHLKAGIISDGKTLTCTDSSYILQSDQGISSTSFTCDYSDGLYKNGEKTVSTGASIGCVKYCSLCDDFDVNPSHCNGCTNPANYVKDGCKVAECPDNKWLRDGGVHVGTVECRKNPENPTKGLWFYSGSDDQVNDDEEGCFKFDCNWISDLRLSEGAHFTSDEQTITCRNPSYFLKTSQGITSASFTCDGSDGLYKNGGKTVLKKESLSCVKDCSACADFTTDFNRCIGCTQPTTTERDGCKFAECPNNKWRINGGVIDGKVECRKDSANPTELAWFVSGGNEKATGGCSEKFNCNEYSQLTLGEGVNAHGKNLSCSDSSFVIKTSQGIVSSSFVCDDSTGLYKDGEKIVQKGEKLICEKDLISNAQKGDANSSAVTFAVCGVFGVILVVGIILAVVFYMRKKRNVVPPKEKNPEPVVEAAKSKTLIVRYVLSVDYVMGAALLTEKLGFEEDHLVLNDATFIKIKPPPLSVHESPFAHKWQENARAQFKSKKDLETYKAFMPLFIRKWAKVIVPYCEMRLSFTEYVLLKTLTNGILVHYRVTEDGKTLCSQHRDMVIAALHRTAELEGRHDPVQRVGEIILLMSTTYYELHFLIDRALLQDHVM